MVHFSWQVTYANRLSKSAYGATYRIWPRGRSIKHSHLYFPIFFFALPRNILGQIEFKYESITFSFACISMNY
ncbi:MAG: hypothetical protein D6730_13030 [Bacteroidetes bacterium]|nr:MAG: hypothetical protein D6730_13030 [Bacteroidota bacterium]